MGDWGQVPHIIGQPPLSATWSHHSVVRTSDFFSKEGPTPDLSQKSSDFYILLQSFENH